VTIDREFEAERNERLERLSREKGLSREELQHRIFQNGPGGFGCHEALHLTHVILGLIERELCDHLAVVQNAHWYARARKAQNELAALYQDIGAAHLAETGRGH
jgi:hypothetical protein